MYGKYKAFSILRLWDLKKFPTHPLIDGPGREEGGGLQFPDLGVLQRKDIKHVRMVSNFDVSLLADLTSDQHHMQGVADSNLSRATEIGAFFILP